MIEATTQPFIPLLTTFVAFGVISIGACALSNTIGITIHAAKQGTNGDLEYVYGSDDAHNFRERMGANPQSQMLVFLISSIALAMVAYAWIFTKTSPWVLVAAAGGHIALVVCRVCWTSRAMYKILQDTRVM